MDARRATLGIFYDSDTEGREREKTPIQPPAPVRNASWLAVLALTVLLTTVALVIAMIILPAIERRERSLRQREDDLSAMVERETLLRDRLERSMKILNKQQADTIVNQSRLRAILEQNLKIATEQARIYRDRQHKESK